VLVAYTGKKVRQMSSAVTIAASTGLDTIFSSLGAYATIALATGTLVFQIFQARIDVVDKVQFSAAVDGDEVELRNGSVRFKVKDIFVASSHQAEPARHEFVKLEKSRWGAPMHLEEGEVMRVPLRPDHLAAIKDAGKATHVGVSLKVLGKSHFRKVAVSTKLEA